MNRLISCRDGLCGAIDCPRCNPGCDAIYNCANCGAEVYSCYLHECESCCELLLCEDCAGQLCNACKEQMDKNITAEHVKNALLAIHEKK